MNSFWGEYPLINQDLIEVESIMKNNAKNHNKIMENALLDLIESGGKLLRPGFLLLSGRFGDYDSTKLCQLAAVVEMLHMATLIHDDIVDNSSLRRGSQTIQSKYGKDYAVFMGDFLFCQCFLTLSSNTSMENMKNLSKAISGICTGEIDQFSSKFSLNISIKKYLKRIAAKTAALFSLSFYIGAHEAGCSENLCKTLAKIGYDIGIAFQIIDDLLDYTSEEGHIGKPTCNDLKEGIYTLPLVYAFQEDKKLVTELLSKDDFTEEEVNNIIKITDELGGIKKTRALAKRYTDRAFSRMSCLPDGESKNVLLSITEMLLWRAY